MRLGGNNQNHTLFDRGNAISDSTFSCPTVPNIASVCRSYEKYEGCSKTVDTLNSRRGDVPVPNTSITKERLFNPLSQEPHTVPNIAPDHYTLLRFT